MKKPLLTLVLMVCLTANTLFACSCVVVSDYFCPSVSNFEELVHVKVLKRYGNVLFQYDDFMDVEIITRLATDITYDTITIIGQDGVNCNAGIYDFMPDDFLILGLSENAFIDDPNDIFEYELYDLSGCGKYFLEVQGDQVVGPISPDVNQQDFATFAADIQDCIDAVTNVNEPSIIQRINLFPSPARNFITIDLPDRRTQASYEVFSADGALVSPIDKLDSNNPTIAVNHLAIGVYFIRLRIDDQFITKRFVKQ